MVLLGVELIGGEIADTRSRIRRRVRAANPADLSAPLSYTVEVLAAEDPEDLDPAAAALSKSRHWVLTALRAGGDLQTVHPPAPKPTAAAKRVIVGEGGGRDTARQPPPWRALAAVDSSKRPRPGPCRLRRQSQRDLVATPSGAVGPPRRERRMHAPQ